MQPRDPIAEIRNLIHAVNERDLDGVMTYFPDEAVLMVEPALPGSPLQTYRGEEQIASWFQQFFGEHLELTAADIRVSGNRVSWEGTMSADRFAGMGVDPVRVRGQAIFDGSLITALTLTLTPESVKDIEAAMARQQAP